MKYNSIIKNPNININNSICATFFSLKCIFIHIPKTAGLSLRKSLLNDNGSYHYSMLDYQNIFTSKFINKAFKFTIVRHPIDRAFSAYTYLKSGGINIVDSAFADEYIKPFNTFNDFINEGLSKNQNIRDFIHFKTQKSYLENSNGIIDIDYIGKLESIDKDYQYISQKLGIKKSLEKINVTKKKSDTLTINDKAIMNLFNVYEEDYKCFNYHFNK